MALQADPENVLFSADLIPFARSIGAYNGSDVDFDFQVRPEGETGA